MLGGRWSGARLMQQVPDGVAGHGEIQHACVLGGGKVSTVTCIMGQHRADRCCYYSLAAWVEVGGTCPQCTACWLCFTTHTFIGTTRGPSPLLQLEALPLKLLLIRQLHKRVRLVLSMSVLVPRGSYMKACRHNVPQWSNVVVLTV